MCPIEENEMNLVIGKVKEQIEQIYKEAVQVAEIRIVFGESAIPHVLVTKDYFVDD